MSEKKPCMLKRNRRHLEERCCHSVRASVCFAAQQQPLTSLIKREKRKAPGQQRTLMVTQNHCLSQAGASCLNKMFISLTGCNIPINQIQSPIWPFLPLEGTPYQGTQPSGIFTPITKVLKFVVNLTFEKPKKYLSLSSVRRLNIVNKETVNQMLLPKLTLFCLAQSQLQASSPVLMSRVVLRYKSFTSPFPCQ